MLRLLRWLLWLVVVHDDLNHPGASSVNHWLSTGQMRKRGRRWWWRSSEMLKFSEHGRRRGRRGRGRDGAVVSASIMRWPATHHGLRLSTYTGLLSVEAPQVTQGACLRRHKVLRRSRHGPLNEWSVECRCRRSVDGRWKQHCRTLHRRFDLLLLKFNLPL